MWMGNDMKMEGVSKNYVVRCGPCLLGPPEGPLDGSFFFLRDFTGLPVLDGIHAPSICDAARPI